MAKKAYWELYEEIQNLKPRTQAYYRAVSRMFGLQINKEALMRVREFRKKEAYKQGKTFSQAVKEYEEGIKYENEVVQRAYDIWSGTYFEKRMNIIADNYISALEKNGISQDIIDYLKQHKDIIKMGGMPPITEFYIPSKGKGKKYTLNIEGSDVLEETIRHDLNRLWGAGLNDKK